MSYDNGKSCLSIESRPIDLKGEYTFDRRPTNYKPKHSRDGKTTCPSETNTGLTPSWPIQSFQLK
jgi:hypothetical protein